MLNSFIIKVCGLRDPENIRAVSTLGVDMIGFIFCDKNVRNVEQLPSNAGIIPDRASVEPKRDTNAPKMVGVFFDDMPQNVITRVYNYQLDYVQLNGDESVDYIDNLKRTLIPDIAPYIKIIKTLKVQDANDVRRWREYEGHVDMFFFEGKGTDEKFDWSMLNSYDGDIPFILGGGIAHDDAERVKAFHHPKLSGINLNSHFESIPGIMDVDKLKTFMDRIK